MLKTLKWSVGCILVEMFTHKALFQGSDRKYLLSFKKKFNVFFNN